MRCFTRFSKKVGPSKKVRYSDIHLPVFHFKRWIELSCVYYTSNYGLYESLNEIMLEILNWSLVLNLCAWLCLHVIFNVWLTILDPECSAVTICSKTILDLLYTYFKKRSKIIVKNILKQFSEMYPKTILKSILKLY